MFTWSDSNFLDNPEFKELFLFCAIINILNSFVYLNILMFSQLTMILFDYSKKLKKKFFEFLYIKFDIQYITENNIKFIDEIFLISDLSFPL